MQFSSLLGDNVVVPKLIACPAESLNDFLIFASAEKRGTMLFVACTYLFNIFMAI